ncbi:MAG: MraY family glycosyltransferase [Janthinobacterium lividum]
MNALVLLTYFLTLLVLELLYFKIAIKYNIIDHPNERSSHSKTTIRGGGIIFSIAMLLGPFHWGWKLGYFLAGLFLICFISFVDDVKSVSNKVRIIFQLISVALLFYQLNVFIFHYYWIVIGFILAIGIINAINFMDGINGITGSYALITLASLYYINEYKVSFTDSDYLLLPILSLVIFNFFNFRVIAKCFAGDVGSVGIAFILIFFLIKLISKTKDVSYLLLLLVYGLDTSTTIFFRILRRENIFEAHRKHFYQFLVNEKSVSHLIVASLYMLVQGIINVVLLEITSNSNLTLMIFITMLVFTLIRLVIEKPGKLIKA